MRLDVRAPIFTLGKWKRSGPNLHKFYMKDDMLISLVYKKWGLELQRKAYFSFTPLGTFLRTISIWVASLDFAAFCCCTHTSKRRKQKKLFNDLDNLKVQASFEQASSMVTKMTKKLPNSFSVQKQINSVPYLQEIHPWIRIFPTNTILVYIILLEFRT